MNALADACPVCHPGDAPAALPNAVRAESGAEIAANYSCPLCGLEWATRWKVSDAWPVSRIYCRTFPLLDEAIGLLADLLDGEELIEQENAMKPAKPGARK